MATPATIADLQELDFGYLTGQDWINFGTSLQPLILKAMTIGIDPIISVNTAYALLTNKLFTKRDLASEYEKRTTDRSAIWVWLTSIYSLEIYVNSLATGIPDNIKQTFQNARDYVNDIMNGQESTPELNPSSPQFNSMGTVVKSNYHTRG
jgi:hypothetical protein